MKQIGNKNHGHKNGFQLLETISLIKHKFDTNKIKFFGKMSKTPRVGGGGL